MSKSSIPWLDKIIQFIEGEDGLEAWIKKYMQDFLVATENLLSKAGHDWLVKVEALVIEAGEMNISSQEKLAWVIEQIAAQSIVSLVALGKSEVNLLIEYILSKAKAAGTVK
jgi:hypothetical protein